LNQVVGGGQAGSWARRAVLDSKFPALRAAITSAALHHPDRPAMHGLAAFHQAVCSRG
jgi:hypothetical protein